LSVTPVVTAIDLNQTPDLKKAEVSLPKMQLDPKTVRAQNSPQAAWHGETVLPARLLEFKDDPITF
jgi:hypothetical protein